MMFVPDCHALQSSHQFQLHFLQCCFPCMHIYVHTSVCKMFMFTLVVSAGECVTEYTCLSVRQKICIININHDQTP